VTADHGHLDQGGHGGRELVVARAPGGRGPRHPAGPVPDAGDDAPTAVLLGSAIPAHNQVDSVDQIDAPEAVQATRAVDLAWQRLRHAALLHDWRSARARAETLNRAGRRSRPAAWPKRARWRRSRMRWCAPMARGPGGAPESRAAGAPAAGAAAVRPGGAVRLVVAAGRLALARRWCRAALFVIWNAVDFPVQATTPSA
jgi:hypothetical protein